MNRAYRPEKYRKLKERSCRKGVFLVTMFNDISAVYKRRIPNFYKKKHINEVLR